MSLFGDLGNIFHSIGHFFGGGDTPNNNNTQAPPPPPPAHPLVTGQPSAPPPPANNQPPPFAFLRPPAPNAQPSQPMQPPAPFYQLYQGPNSNQPLTKVAPPTQPAPPHPDLLHTLADGAKFGAGLVPGVSLGVLRAGESMAQGVTDIPKLALDFGTWAGDKISGTNYKPGYVKAVEDATNAIDKPQQALQKLTDNAAQAYGPGSNFIYKPANIATQIATAIPAGATLLSKAGELGQAGKLGELGELTKLPIVQKAIDGANSVNKFVDAQRAASPAMQMLDKVRAGAADSFHQEFSSGAGDAGAVNKMGTATDTKVAAGIQAPDEVSPGLKSVNPNQGADALSAIQQKEAQQAAIQPATPQSTPPLTPVDPEASPAGSQVPPTVPEPQTPPPATPPMQSTQPIHPSSEPPTVNTSNNVPQPPTDVNTAPNAPKIIDSINKEIASNNPGDVHVVMEKQAMAQRALQTAETTDLPAAIAQHAAGSPVVQTPQDAMDATALMRRMYTEAKDDPAAKAARDNLANAVAEYGSKGGQAVNVMKDVTAGLPPDAKASVMSKTFEKIWQDDPNRPDLLKTDSGQAHLEATLTSMMEQAEGHNSAIARLEGEMESLGHDEANIPQLHDLGGQLNSLRLRAAIDNGEASRFISQLMPQRSGVERLADWARTSMLTSIGGRLNNFANVGSNSAYEATTSLVQSQLNKVFNSFLDDSSKLSDASLLNRRAATGVVQGLKKAGAEFKGKALSETPVEKLVKSGTTDAYGMSKVNDNKGFFSKMTNTVHAAVNAPKNIFGQGVKEGQLFREARQEGLRQGLTGGELDAYSVMRSYVPSRQMAAKGQELMDQVSHTNKNWLADTVGKWAEGGRIDNSNLRGVVGLVRNTILPFAKYPATFLWNTITDRNVIADSARLGASLWKGDTEGVTKALSRAVVDGTLGVTGWHLASSGLITNKDGNGYSDSGMYLHLGNRSIPLGILGVVAEPLLGGAALQQSMHAGGNLLENFGKALVNTAVDTIKVGGAMSLIGGDNQAVSTLQNAASGQNGVTGTDAAAQVGAQSVGQFIPGAASDANAFLNGGIPGIGGTHPLNPTGEAALTKVAKGDSGMTTNDGLPSKAKDIPATAVKQLENRVPVLSQSLPRNPGTTAPDIIDRVTRGSHVGSTQQAALVKATAPNSPNQIKVQLEADKASFLKMNKETATINGKTWVNLNGDAHQYPTPLKAQQAIDEAKFKAGQGGDLQQKNGMVYERGSDGKVTTMEQKDYDYRQASDAITSAKDNRDLNGTLNAQSKLLENVQWQLNHADTTSANHDHLIDTAAKTQAEFNKYQLWGGFSKPKGAPSYEPTFTGSSPKSSGYIKEIQRAGAKYGVDINALMSVAAQEGLGGGVGDNGTSFGPFQLHVGGALPEGKDQAWAESPEGIDYAVQQIAKVAGGKIGPEAIKAIVTQFERSADQPTEIANALAVYEGGTADLRSTSGSGGGLGSSITSSASGSASASKAATLLRENKIGSLPALQRESFINDMSAKPINLSIPQIKLTDPETLIKAHKITVGMPKA